MKIFVKARELSIVVELNNSLTAQNIVKRLPLDAVASRWGDEIFFETPVESFGGPATVDVNVGDIGFFHAGKCFCIFFGRTPASVIDKPVPEAPVEIIGRVTTSVDILRGINAGDAISLIPCQEPVSAAPVPAPGPAFTPAAAAGGERKLSQTEIDDLVKRLLEAKKKPAGSP